MRLQRTPSRQRGAAAIEFALLALPLATLTFGITEFGRALHQFNTIAKSARDAVRYQSTGTPATRSQRAASR
jgi:Flp pilus assembly protein TadG